jgi:hypothetical protein
MSWVKKFDELRDRSCCPLDYLKLAQSQYIGEI